MQAGELAKESAQKETGSLGAGSDCASTRGMAGSIISSYTLPDRYIIFPINPLFFFFFLFGSLIMKILTLASSVVVGDAPQGVHQPGNPSGH